MKEEHVQMWSDRKNKMMPNGILQLKESGFVTNFIGIFTRFEPKLRALQMVFQQAGPCFDKQRESDDVRNSVNRGAAKN
jgi:hypothetical protein